MDGRSQRRQGRLVTSSSAPTQQQQRNDESWVEIASQPSSSSLSSIGDEIVTTGLRVAGGSSYPPRRRRSYPARNSYPLANPPPPQAGGASSQEEYEASESDDDRALASSTEQSPPTQVPPPRFRAPPDSDSESESEDDDDENLTALGTRGTGDYVFRPEPNAFSNPPSTVGRRRSSVAAPAANSTNRPGPSHRSQPRARRQPDYMSPSYQADNDAALRASLTTLLSCAAAARGLNKKEDERHGPSPTGAGAAGTSNQPMELRLVPEAELMNESPSAAAASPPPASSPSPARSSSRTGKPKRTASALRGARASKKKRTEEQPTLISPTLMTWVVSAGVVVLVSVVGFGAGYVIGREVGRQEVLGGGAVNASDAGCGKEVMRSSVKRLRFGGIGRTAVKS